MSLNMTQNHKFKQFKKLVAHMAQISPQVQKSIKLIFLSRFVGPLEIVILASKGSYLEKQSISKKLNLKFLGASNHFLSAKIGIFVEFQFRPLWFYVILAKFFPKCQKSPFLRSAHSQVRGQYGSKNRVFHKSPKTCFQGKKSFRIRFKHLEIPQKPKIWTFENFIF